MVFRTCGQPRKVHSRVFARSSGFTDFRLASPFLGDPNKLAGVLPPPGPPNDLKNAPVPSEVPLAPPGVRYTEDYL